MYPATVVKVTAKAKAHTYTLLYHDGDTRSNVKEVEIDNVRKHPAGDMKAIDLRTMEKEQVTKMKTALTKNQATLSVDGWIVAPAPSITSLTSLHADKTDTVIFFML